jgi:hypothetical protein
MEPEFETFIREHAIDDVRRDKGVASAWFGRRELDATGDYVAVTCWRDFETMRAAVGADLERPIFAPAGREPDVAGTAEHYETIDEPAVGSGVDGTVLRLLRGRITRGREEEVYASIRQEGWPLLARLDGIVDARIGRQASRDGDAILHVTIWDDLTSLEKATGGTLDRPLMPMAPDSFTVESIRHFDIIESSTLAPSLSGGPRENVSGG